MKLKNLSLIAAAIALSLTATHEAKAQTNSPQPPQQVAPAQKKDAFERLGLTDAQKTQLKEIRENSKSQIEAILTPAQREQLKTAIQSGERKRGFASLNLTSEQKTQIREIKQSSRQKMEAVLTPEQQEQLKQMRQNRPQGRNRKTNY
ncbi:MAG: P pilus assembly/Cpx signaling pathway, periplasmic inhibitor/zinc-resistance associated protein [Cyanomargarita calcarea GSE-NOS-MK-12-04C]|jgi:Spy/CpxP family protein refolding chaperone|uniref:P pilus assembly/Cpx signaling pathway, periplasmic inhibitor/zinc-resistance associated protein n=1 Tax=Cyanomargarita calcarea GSE-NOS-MK-12-04C TaxID=2839659 RepID=A0A951QNN0_9CYAN|nr:P pilus assembly/Cpx signaling pathway, periplasmic inhibitor/zinc-resistance associated protein [Cyanomargarita calcarea GSE-NOS-MK-12-04C]